jgi:hypothetical protein
MEIFSVTLTNGKFKHPLEPLLDNPDLKMITFIGIKTTDDIPGLKVGDVVVNSVAQWELLIPKNKELYNLFYPHRRFIKCV